jgi:hypothetical protein
MRFSSLVVGAMAVSVSAAQADLPTVNGFKGIWYEITSGAGSQPNKYGGGLATYPQQHAPLAIYSATANKTFFTYGGRDPSGGDLQHMISYYDHATGLVARPRVWMDTSTQGQTTTDAHDNPVMAIDSDGYIYQFSNVHGNNRKSYIRRSAQPFDITNHVGLLSSNDPVDTAVFGSTPRFSYGGAWYVPHYDQFFLAYTNYSPGTERDLYFTTSPDADTWASTTPFAHMESGQYQTTWIKPDGKTIGTIFDLHPSSGLTGSGNDARTNLYYLESDDLGVTWRAANGTVVPIPLNSKTNNALVREYQSQGLNVYIKDVNYDAAGRPVIMYETTPGSIPGPNPNPRTVRVAYFDGSTWQDNAVTTTDHNYDHGSIYIEGNTWRIIAPYIDGPQAFGTGGEVGVWLSTDQGETWTLSKQLTSNSVYNHTYVRRPLHADDDFYAFWASGDAFDPSIVELYFSDKAGNVYKLPYTMDGSFMNGDFAQPILVHAVPEPAFLAPVLLGALALRRRR